MIIGKSLHGRDSKSLMFDDDSVLPKCSKCGYRLDFQAHNPNYRLKSQKYDWCSTYDGQTVCSLKFKRFCEQNGYDSVRFFEFDQDETHFHVIVDRIVEFDPVKRKTSFENHCSVCGNYESITGATPSYLKINRPLSDGFTRTDLIFASGNEKRPLIIVGLETEAKIIDAGLTGCYFNIAYGHKK